MKQNEQIIEILELQSENIKVTQIAKKLETTVPKLKEFMNEQGYSYDKGVFIEGELEQLCIGDGTATKSISKRKSKITEEILIEEKNEPIEVEKETIDKLCEMRDWYLEVKDLKKLKPRINTKTTEVHLDEELIIAEHKRITVKIDDEIYTRLERLLVNTEQDRDIIINQAILNLLNEYKHLA